MKTYHQRGEITRVLNIRKCLAFVGISVPPENNHVGAEVTWVQVCDSCRASRLRRGRCEKVDIFFYPFFYFCFTSLYNEGRGFKV